MANKPEDMGDNKEITSLRRTSSLRNKELLKNTSSLMKRKLSFVSGTLLFNQDNNAKIKSSLSSKENPEMADDLGKILALLRKNYNDIKNSNDIDMNIKRMDNVQKCLTLLKKLTLAPDNHKPILEGGFMNFMEKLDKDYKLIKDDGTPDVNNRNLGFHVNGKNVLQACSNSDNAIPIITESPVFDSTIKEVLSLYNNPELIGKNGDVQKVFLYDNVIFSNLCKDKKAFDEIFNKIGLDKLLSLGKKTGNINLLDASLNMLKNYVKNTPNKEDIPPEVLDSCLQILDKCIRLNDRNAPLMAKVLDLVTNLYSVDKYKPNIENLKLLKSINNDMPKFKNDHDYLNSALNCISALTKDNPYNGQETLNCGLFQSLNNEVSNLLKDGPEKFDQKNDGDEANGYLKTCLNLAKLYNSLVKNDMDNIDKFNKLGVTENTIKMLDTFNDKVKPLTEEEKEALDEKKAKLLKAGQKKTEPYRNKALSDSKDEKMPIQCIKLRSDQLENLADLKNNLPKKYTAEDLFESPDNKFEEDLNPDYYYMKILDDARSRPFPGLEKVDTGDDNILVLKISKKSLENYSKPDIPQDQLSKVRHLFKEADEQNAGVECYYRKVLDKDLDHPETAKLEKIPLDEDVDELYNKIKEKEGEFKSPEEGIQLLKVVGFNVNPKELNNHIVDVKKLYNKKDKEGHSSGTTVQCVKVNRPNKEGKKEPVQFIKTVRGEVKPGEEPISFYRVGGNADLRQLLEDIQTTGVPKGKDGVDYIKVKGDADLADVRELFKGTENDPKTYYYTSQAKGDGKVYGDGKINSVTVLSDPKNKLNKNSQVLQVFRKVEDANEKPVKDNDKYYYTKALGDLNKGLKPNETTRDTNMKDIYNKVKGDMSNKPDDEEYIFLIKVKGDKSVNDALNKIKLSGAMDSRPAQPEENDFHLNKIRGNTKMKDVYLDVKKPNGALLIKAPKDNGLDDIIKQVKTSGILKDEKGKKPLLKSTQGKDREQPLEKSYISSPDSKVIGKPQKVKGNDNIQYMLLKGDMLNKFDNPNNLGSMFKSGKPEKTPDRNPVFYYRKISSPPSPDDSDLKNIQGKTNVDDLYKQLKNSGDITGKPKEGVQIFKVTGPVDSNDFVKHIQDSEALYKKPDEEDQQIRVRSVKLYPHGKEAGEDDCIVYIKVTGGNKPDTYYKNQGPVDLNDFMQQIQEKGTPEKNGKPYEVVSGDELNKVKGYFKPKDDDLKKPKEKSDDGKSPKAYFYTSKVISKGDKENPSIINSVTLLSDPNNNLNKGQNMEQLFMVVLKAMP